MKCMKCGAEWTPNISSDNKKCPFCGEIVVDDVPYQQAIDALRMVISRFGKEIYSEDNRLNGLINDLLPNALKEKNILRSAVSFGLPKVILELANDPNEKEQLLKRAYELSETNGLNEEWRRAVLFIFSYPLNVDSRDAFPLSNAKVKSKLKISGSARAKSVSNSNDASKTASDLEQLADEGDLAAILELAEKYYNGNGVQQDYKTAFRYYKRADVLESEVAQYSIGVMYDNAQGVEHDPEKAFIYYKKAAEKGFAPAQTSLGEQYYFGIGCQKNDSEAVYWLEKSVKEYPDANVYITLATIYKDTSDASLSSPSKSLSCVQKAIDEGSETALNLMGLYYELGYGVEKDYSQAVHYYQLAADNGVESAYVNLGAFYQYGYGVSKDERKAIEYYQLGAKAGNMYCLNALGVCYRNGIGVAQNYEKAFELYQEAASYGNPAAEYNIAVAYENGESVEKDVAEAKRWYMLSADKGFGKAMAKLGFYAEKGLPDGNPNIEEALEWYVKSANVGDTAFTQWIVGNCRSQGLMGSYVDRLEAFEWYMKAANNGNATSQNNVACEYLNGIIVDQDFDLAAEWFEKAVAQDDQYALDNYGRMLFNGNGVPRDVSRGVSLLERAAEQGNVSAMSNLGVCCFEGWGTPRDLDTALKWLSKADAAGDEQARVYLEKGYKNKNGTWQKRGLFGKVPTPEPLPPEDDTAQPTEGCKDFCKYHTEKEGYEERCYCERLGIDVFVKTKCPYHHSLIADLADILINEKK